MTSATLRSSRWIRLGSSCGCLSRLSLLLPLVVALPIPARADASRVEAGDVLEIAVAGIPELRQRIAVNRDGEASFPLIGDVSVVGLQLPEVRARVRELLSNKVFRQRTVDGRERLVSIWPEEVVLDIVEYRPVYLNGDVSRPGEQRYRPGLTVRQVVALGGGYDIMRFRSANPVLESADLRSEYEVLWTEFAREQAQALRLRTELSQKPGSDAELVAPPIPSSVAAEITKLETDQMRVRDAVHQKDRTHLQRSIELADSQLSALVEQQKRGEEGAKADVSDLDAAKTLHNRGMAPLTRVLEARRAVFLSSTSFLQSAAQVSAVTREREELKRRLQNVDDQRRLDLLRELQAANLRLATLRARLQAVGEKLVHTAALRSQLVRGRGGKPQIDIVRKIDQSWHRFSGDEDTELLPGDTVEVALQSEAVMGLQIRQSGPDAIVAPR